jgi:ADP-ribosylglycohydrolase
MVTPPTALVSAATVRRMLEQVLGDKAEQGHVVADLRSRLAAATDSYDDLLALAADIAAAPLDPNWPYVEPSDLDGIRAQWTATPDGVPAYDAVDVAGRIETAFLARVAGCILGKPFEFDPTLAELRAVLEPAGEWPLTDYVTEATNARLRAPQPQWPELVRERITHVAEDDDLNYTVLAMLLLEQHGSSFTGGDVRRLWLRQLPVLATFGPERTQLLAAGLATLDPGGRLDGDAWADLLNPADEHCGALIRADAYGYACPGRPVLAATLAWQDSVTTHRRTGVYACMFVAAAIADALVTDPADRLGPLRRALAIVPRRSRLAAIVQQSLDLVADATDWLSAYEQVHERFGHYTHCRVYQEIGTLAVTMRFADDVGHGIGLQVCQGNDTDSFGATAGSLLGALLGPEAFDRRWVEPFNDRIHLALATFHEQSLSALATRMSQLPATTTTPR